MAIGNTTIKVWRSGVPVENIHVLVGSVVGDRMKTNANGKVDFDLTTDWQGYVDVHMEDDAGIVATATIHIKEGRNHDVDFVPSTIP
jgi:uncharacterized GH25 family protein